MESVLDKAAAGMCLVSHRCNHGAPVHTSRTSQSLSMLVGFSLWCIIGVSCAVSGISTSTVLLAAEHRSVATSKRAPLCRQETLQLACTRACFVSRPCQRSGRKPIDISCSSIASPRFHTPHQTAVTAAGHRLVVATHGASKEVPFHCSGPSSRFS